MSFDFKVRDTILSFDEILGAYTDMCDGSFNEEGNYDPFLKLCSERIAFISYFLKDVKVDDIVDGSIYFCIIPDDIILKSDSEVKEDLMTQFQNIRSCVEDYVSYKQRDAADTLMKSISSFVDASQSLISQVDIEKINGKIKDFTPEAVVAQYASALTKNNDSNNGNVIKLK